VRCIDGAPAGLGGVDQLVGHGQTRRSRSRPLGDLRAQTHCGKGGFDRVRGTLYEVDSECFDRDLGLIDVLGVVDVLHSREDGGF
jgi:hypothetical protein